MIFLPRNNYNSQEKCKSDSYNICCQKIQLEGEISAPEIQIEQNCPEQKLKDEPPKKVKRDNKGFIENVAGAVIATQVGNVQAGNIKNAGEILKKIPEIQKLQKSKKALRM